MGLVHVIVPAGIDDEARPSGGNHYDRRVIDALPSVGWEAQEHQTDATGLAAELTALGDGAFVLVDGLLATAAEPLVDRSRRLRLVVLLHMPFSAAARPEDAAETARVEAAVLHASAAVITTSEWTRDWIVTHHNIPADRVWTAPPGVDPAPLAGSRGSSRGHELLCVGPLVPAKGQDVLMGALAEVRHFPWRCTLVGATDSDPGFVTSLLATIQNADFGDRVTITGPLTRPELANVRSRADLAISTSRHEAYGMGVAEALAAGIPVIVTDIGGHREALGQASDDSVPGTLVPADDPHALAHVLRQWLTDAPLRRRWRESAVLRRDDLAGWRETARAVASALDTLTD